MANNVILRVDIFASWVRVIYALVLEQAACHAAELGDP